MLHREITHRIREKLRSGSQRETLTIAGFALDGKDWDGIYLGQRKGNDLAYAGKVDHGFDETSAAELRRRLTPLIRKTQPYSKKIAPRAIWGEPELLAEIEYRAESAEGKVRHPFFKGLAGGPVTLTTPAATSMTLPRRGPESWGSKIGDPCAQILCHNTGSPSRCRGGWRGHGGVQSKTKSGVACSRKSLRKIFQARQYRPETAGSNRR